MNDSIMQMFMVALQNLTTSNNQMNETMMRRDNQLSELIDTVKELAEEIHQTKPGIYQ